ncbi:MAG: fused MFS/spermidine synthase [Sedimentisphaerales bacterium]
MSTKVPATPVLSMPIALMRWGVYACFFFSGATAIIFEVLWSRQFVTVFGNSAYAISIVLCAYMTGLGLGGLVGGWFADRVTQRAAVYGIVQIGVAAWAMAIPTMLTWLRELVPALTVLSPESLFVSTMARFGLSFAILVVPCFLMGTTLPLLVRALTESERFIGSRIGMLYCLNSLGAALGCLAAGFWMIETIGLGRTNLAAIGVNIAIAVTAMALSRPVARAITLGEAKTLQDVPANLTLGREQQPRGVILLILAFMNGLAGLACEVVWIRYLAFFSHTAYVFPTILCVYLLGIGLGGLVYGLLAGWIKRPIMALGFIEMMLAVSVIATFIISAFIYAEGPPPPLELKGMALVTVLFSTVLMGISFPLLCAVYGRQVKMLGRRTGLLVAINTAGTVAGSLLPVFVLVPMLGIQKSITLISAIYGVMGLVLLASGGRSNWGLVWRVAVGFAMVLLFSVRMVPSNLCQRVFLAGSFNLAKHTDITFYREGRTGTAVVTRDKVDGFMQVYINGVSEVPLLYCHKICFKMIGDLAPMLHPNPDEVLMICFGGGVAAGATAQIPEVKRLTIVDLENSVIDAAKLLDKENNGLLDNPKAHIVIDDGRNYIMTSHQKWPVIVSDSTHPKSGDSWVLYTQEFYRLVREHLTNDGVFVEWVPLHDLSIEEFKIIVRTFQSVFPHTSLWVTEGLDERGSLVAYTLLAATPEPLKIDVNKLRDRLNVEAVRRDLEPFSLHTPAGFLDTFFSAEEQLRQWAGNGPVNTDDLPFTQYQTAYSENPMFENGNLIEPMEDIWPYLAGTGSPQEAEHLRQELALRAKASRLVLQGQIRDAYTLLPNDERYKQMQHFYEVTSGIYIRGLVNMYWDDPKFLEHLVGVAAGDKAVVPICERILQFAPDNVVALSTLGVMRIKNESWQEAENYLMRAVHLKPNSGDIRFNLGLVLDKTGRHAEALEQWKEAATTAKDDKSANQLGVRLAKEGKLEEAIQWFRLATDINPTSKIVRLNLARALFTTGRADEALTHLRYVLKIDPQNETALNMLAKIKTRDKTDGEDKGGLK